MTIFKTPDFCNGVALHRKQPQQRTCLWRNSECVCL